MSTVCEAMAARHCGMKVLGISCITNMAAGLGEDTLSHEDVGKTANAVSDSFTLLLKSVLEKM